MLIASLVGIDHRTTMDMDATLHNYPLTEDTIRKILSEICTITMRDDVTIAIGHITPIRDSDEYGGYQVSLITNYESIITSLKMDITTGDIITPNAVWYTFQAIQNPEDILLTIESDPSMKQRWEHYRKDNHYARGINFDNIISILLEITNPNQ